MYGRKKVLFIGQNNSLLALLSKTNDTEVISSVKFLDTILFNFIPNLIVFNSLDDADILTVRKNERLHFTPVLITEESFEGFGSLYSVARFPKVIMCNLAIAEKKDFLMRLQSVIEKKEDVLPAKTGEIVKHAIFFINKQYAQDLNRNKIAAHCGVAPDYLSRIFHREEGISLTSYLSLFRLFMARLMLIETSFSIKEISAKCGFSSPAYFTNLFKAEYKLSPGHFRKK